MRENGNHDAAFPCPHSEAWSNNQDGAPYQAGMTLRDYFAAQALVGMGTWMPAGFAKLNTKDAREVRALFAYSQADAMLAARTPSPTGEPT
jgi:hypothetical protein